MAANKILCVDHFKRSRGSLESPAVSPWQTKTLFLVTVLSGFLSGSVAVDWGAWLGV